MKGKFLVVWALTVTILGMLLIDVGRKLETCCGWRGKTEDMLLGLGEEPLPHGLLPHNSSGEGEAGKDKQLYSEAYPGIFQSSLQGAEQLFKAKHHI